MRIFLTLIIVLLSSYTTEGQNCNALVVADSTSRKPLPSASVFDRRGNALGVTDTKGRLPYISPVSYPITVRYLGFREKVITNASTDTIYLREAMTELPEVVVESRQHKVLHILAYMREYSTLSTYTDTVFLFREKMVDYMIIPNAKLKFRGWRTPRTLKSESYYRFTNSQGLDSVSDKCRHHFSWSDWMSIMPSPQLPSGIRNTETGTDTLYGKYSPTEVWIRNNARLTIDINVLADTTSRKWVPNLKGFFRDDLDYENFRVRFSYNDVVGDSIALTDMTGYSFNIESNGRGHDMFRFNRIDEPFYVTTYAEVYIIDKEFITVNEGKKWDKRDFDLTEIEIIEPTEAAELQEPIKHLVSRVKAIDRDEIRLNLTPDSRLMGRKVRWQNIGQRALSLLKQAVGITYYKSHKNFNDRWSDFTREQKRKNKDRENEP